MFGIEPNDHAIYLDEALLGPASRNSRHAPPRSGVRPTRKIKKQKGTGTARAGIKNLLFRGGGTVFGPEPRDYTQKLNGVEEVACVRPELQSEREKASLWYSLSIRAQDRILGGAPGLEARRKEDLDGYSCRQRRHLPQRATCPSTRDGCFGLEQRHQELFHGLRDNAHEVIEGMLNKKAMSNILIKPLIEKMLRTRTTTATALWSLTVQTKSKSRSRSVPTA